VSEWGLLVAVAVVSYFAQKCNIFAYKHGEASLLASLDYVRLLWATLFGYLVFNQFPGGSTWFGAAIVVAAAIFMVEEIEEPVKYLSRYGLLRNSGIQNKVRKSLYFSLMKNSLMT
jgi:EamA domain-containing membrane protein RarD